MKRYLNYIVVILLGIHVSLLDADYYADDNMRSIPCVTLCCPSYNLEFQCRPLWFRPGYSNLSYAVEVITKPTFTPTWKVHGIHPSYHFGFDLTAAYVFDCRNTMITCNWEHFQSKDTDTVTVGTDDIIGPLFAIGTDASLYKKAKGRARCRYDLASINYGILLKFCHSLKTHLYVGVASAWIKQSLHSRFSDLKSTIIRSIQTPSRFTGTGPQIGLDLSYNILWGFSLEAQSSAGILIGSVKNHTRFESTSPLLSLVKITPPNKQTTSVHTSTQSIPTAGGRIGFKYGCEFYDSTVELGFGYESRVFFNAIQSVDISSEILSPPTVPNTINVFARSFQKNLSNFTLSGPYLTFNLGFKF